MKILLSIILFALLSFEALSASRITTTITVTNVPVTGNSITVNSTTRIWSNIDSSSYVLTNLSGIGPSTTNLANNLASFPLVGPFSFLWSSTNSFKLIGPLGGSVSASAAGNWATISLSTQSGPDTFTAIWPLENIPGDATNRTNQASSLVYGLGIFSTNAFPTNSTAVSNLLQKGAGPLQIVSAPVLFGSIGGTVGAITNGYAWGMALSNALVNIVGGLASNLIVHSLISTNGTNFGLALSSPGAYPNSQQFGGASVSGGFATSLGAGATSATNGTAIGASASAGVFGVAIGAGSDSSSGTNSVAIGQNSTISVASNAVALGQNSIVGNYHHGSVAIGQNSTTTTNNQVMLGSSSHTVSVPGVLAISGTQTNTTFTGTNILNGRLDFTSRANTSLANGNNSGVVLGTNVYVRLSGATTIAYIAGFAAEQDGSYHIVEISGAVTNTIGNQSGVDPTAANRVIIGTGADISYTNNPTIIQVIYNSSDARWKLIGVNR